MRKLLVNLLKSSQALCLVPFPVPLSKPPVLHASLSLSALARSAAYSTLPPSPPPPQRESASENQSNETDSSQMETPKLKLKEIILDENDLVKFYSIHMRSF
jgi:hypothetical protein